MVIKMCLGQPEWGRLGTAECSQVHRDTCISAGIITHKVTPRTPQLVCTLPSHNPLFAL